jgi:hypothetical protein
VIESLGEESSRGRQIRFLGSSGRLRVTVPNTCRSSGPDAPVAQCFLHSKTCDLLMAIEAFGVNLQEHLYRVPGPLGDLGSWYAPVEPR